MSSRTTPWLYLATPLLMLAVFFFLPFFQAIGISMLDYSHDLYNPDFVGLDNYTRLFQTPAFWQAFQNTIVFLIGVVPAMVALPVVLAILLNGQLKGIAFFRAMIYLPVVISMVVVGITWKWLLDSNGLVNYLLSFVGIPKINWLVSPDVALIALMIVSIWKGLGYYMMMYLAHLQNVGHELYEAAEMDGASTLQKHWHVTLPHLRPTMTMVAIISTIGCLKVFVEIYVMTRGGPVGSTKTLVYYIYERAFERLDLGIASAAGIVLMLVLVGLSLAQLRFGGEDPDIKPQAARLEKADA